MKAMLDTSAYSALMHGDQAVMNVVSMAAEILVPAVVLGELYSGFKRGTRTRENVAQLDRFLSKPTVRVVSLTSDTAIRYAEIDVYLLGKGKPIPRNDVWIAASAMEHGSQLLTLDAHFRQIPLLPLQP